MPCWILRACVSGFASDTRPLLLATAKKARISTSSSASTPAPKVVKGGGAKPEAALVRRAGNIKAMYQRVVASHSNMVVAVSKDTEMAWASSLLKQLVAMEAELQQSLTPFARSYLNNDASVCKKKWQTKYLYELNAFCDLVDNKLTDLDKEQARVNRMIGSYRE